MPPPAQTTLATVLGALRLAHKYDMQFLCCRASQHLGTVYCTRLKDKVRAFEHAIVASQRPKLFMPPRERSTGSTTGDVRFTGVGGIEAIATGDALTVIHDRHAILFSSQLSRTSPPPQRAY
jgi:hypothetical protein